VPESGLGRTPDFTAAATDGAAHPPDPFGGDTITLTSPVVPAGRIATIPVLVKDAGHAVLDQYPNEISKILQTFLSATTPSS